MVTTVIRLNDRRDTVYTVETLAVSGGECCAENGKCGKPGVITVSNTMKQQKPTENSTAETTLCADHNDGVGATHQKWVESASALHETLKRAEFLASLRLTSP